MISSFIKKTYNSKQKNEENSNMASTTLSVGEPLVKTWHQQAIDKIQLFEDEKINQIRKNIFQSFFDNIGERFEATMQSLPGRVQRTLERKFASAIETVGRFSQKLATHLAQFPLTHKFVQYLSELVTFLVTLPFKSACNIARSVYQVLKAAAYTAVHPMKAMTALAKALVRVANELTKIDTWIKIGAGMIGTSFGQLVYGNPMALLGFILGGMVLIGATILKTHEWQNNIGTVKEYCKMVPEAMMTGFLMGLLIGGIQEMVYKRPVITQQEAELHGQEYFTRRQGIVTKAAIRFERDIPELTMTKCTTDGTNIHVEIVEYVRATNETTIFTKAFSTHELLISETTKIFAGHAITSAGITHQHMAEEDISYMLLPNPGE